MTIIHRDSELDEPWELKHQQHQPNDANYVEPANPVDDGDVEQDMWDPERESPWLLVFYAAVIVGTVLVLVAVAS